MSPCIPHCMWIVTWEWALPHLFETGPVYWSWTLSPLPVSAGHMTEMTTPIHLYDTPEGIRLTCDLLCTGSSYLFHSIPGPHTHGCIRATVWTSKEKFTTIVHVRKSRNFRVKITSWDTQSSHVPRPLSLLQNYGGSYIIHIAKYEHNVEKLGVAWGWHQPCMRWVTRL